MVYFSISCCSNGLSTEPEATRLSAPHTWNWGFHKSKSSNSHLYFTSERCRKKCMGYPPAHENHIFFIAMSLVSSVCTVLWETLKNQIKCMVDCCLGLGGCGLLTTNSLTGTTLSTNLSMMALSSCLSMTALSVPGFLALCCPGPVEKGRIIGKFGEILICQTIFTHVKNGGLEDSPTCS